MNKTECDTDTMYQGFIKHLVLIDPFNNTAAKSVIFRRGKYEIQKVLTLFTQISKLIYKGDNFMGSHSRQRTAGNL